MGKKRWFRFHIDPWLNGTFGLSPNEIAVLITILCELYDHEGFARLDKDLMARRCGMRPTSFRKALDTLVRRGKVVVNGNHLTSNAVTAEIKSREKLDGKSEESRKKLAEKRNEISAIRQNISSNTEYRIQRDNLRGSALPLPQRGREEESQAPDAQAHMLLAIDGGSKSDAAIAGLRKRQQAAR